MEIRPSPRIASLTGYAFAEINARVGALREAGIEVVDFGVGDPTVPTPELVREACKRGVDAHAASGYPCYEGSRELRAAAAAWIERRFGVPLDPGSEVTSTIGSKEAVFNFHEALVAPGDVVLCPSPGYPPYVRGTLFAEGRPFHVPVWPRSGFLPDLARVPEEVARRARLLWVCHPHAPTGRCLTLDELRRIYEWAAARDIAVASDEAYVDFYYDREPPPSMLEVSRDGVIAFYSLSKRSAMTGYRVGFAAGDPRLVRLLRSVKTNLDSGTPWFVEDAAVAALSDEAHVVEMRAFYARNRALLCDGLEAAGLPRCVPEGTIYVWQVPDGMPALDFARRLLEPPLAVVVTPGPLIAEALEDGTNPGEGHVRFALVPPEASVRRAAERIASLRF
jgi:LL-diaminopimelate aminotransferase